MPYLDWKSLTPEQLRQEVGPSAAARPEGEQDSHQAARSAENMRMTLSLEPALLTDLAGMLRDSLDADAPGELRLELPRGWIVFWKKREGESRLLLAHPQPDQWVATVAVAAAPASTLVEGIEQLASASNEIQPLSIGALPAPEGWGSVSNLELVLARL